MFLVIWWGLVLVAVTGTVYVSVLKKVRLGHLLWIVSNIGLVMCNAFMGAWPMVGLFTVYTVLSALGFIRWKGEKA